jgi:hypothetical protein
VCNKFIISSHLTKTKKKAAIILVAIRHDSKRKEKLGAD